MSLRSELKQGVFWIALAKYFGVIISLCIVAILSRHIGPAAFGTMAVATVLMAFLEIFSDFGIGSSIIQFKDLTKHQLNSLFMVGCGIGIILSSIFFLLSNPIAEYYSDQQLKIVCRCLAVALLFYAFNIVPNGLMYRDKRFKAIALRTLSIQIICGIIATWGAMHGWGLYALIITPVITPIGVFIVNFINYPQKIIFNIDLVAIKKVWGYSSFQFLFNIINYFSRNIDKLIIGKHFSMTDLGYYDKSYRLMQMPLQNITFVITPVLHPILSTLQDNKSELAIKNAKLTTILSQISFPLGILLYFCARDIILIVFGPEWMPAVPIFKILALSVPLQVILSSAGSVFLASGKSNHLFYSGLTNTIVTVSGFFIAATIFKTIESIAWAWDITLLINFVSTYFIMYKITFKNSLKQFLKSFTHQIINSLIVGSITYPLSRSITISSPIFMLLLNTLIIITLTSILAYVLNQYNAIHIIRDIVGQVFKSHLHKQP